ncbi:MAG: Phosphatidylserine decarboxylase, partial [Halothiobacillaceae bacterium]
WQIRLVIKRFNVDMSIAEKSDPNDFASFNHFFTRTLKPEARPIVSGVKEIACPVDGAISQIGEIVDGKIFQAKKHQFNLIDLLGGSRERAHPFQGGSFTTIYLSPRDYHRIHMPATGELLEMVHVPGRLFSVSPRTTENVPALFARNERVVALFNTEYGPMAMILVGALFVGSMDTVWAGNVAPRQDKRVRVWDYRYRHDAIQPIILKRGEEMGRFNMGSTVILLFGPQAIHWAKELRANSQVKMGQLLAKGY